MLKLEDIKKDAQLWGIEPGHIVRVVTVDPVGEDALSNGTASTASAAKAPTR